MSAALEGATETEVKFEGKKIPLTTALAPWFRATWNFTFHLTVQTAYSPWLKLPTGRTRVSRTAPVAVSVTVMVSARAVESQSRR